MKKKFQLDPEFAKSIEESWAQYKAGNFITHEDLMKEYGLSNPPSKPLH